MASLMEQLTETLTEQSEIYDRLAELSGEKRDVLVNNEIERLQQITSAENALVGRNQKLDRIRQTIFKDLASVLNRPVEDLTLTDIADITKDQSENKRLRDLAQRLRESVNTLKERNDQNKVLIEYSLDYIDFSMNVLRATMQNERTFYSVDGDQLNNDTMFDAKQ